MDFWWLSDFRPRGPISTATFPSTQMPIQMSIFCLYCGILYLRYEGNPCSCTHTISILSSITDAISSGSWLILFKILTLNVAICIMHLNLSNFGFCSVADFLITGRTHPALPARKVMQFDHVVWVWVLVIFRWLCFILINRRHSNRWVTAVPRLNYLTLAVDSWDSSAQDLVRRGMASEVYLVEKIALFIPLRLVHRPRSCIKF